MFISYAQGGGEGLAKDLRARLEDNGIPLWQDRGNHVDQWVGALAIWAPALDKIEPGLTRSVLTNVVRIVAWIRTEWAPIESVLGR